MSDQNSTSTYPNCLYKKYIKEFFRDLRKTSYPLYAFFEHLPYEYFFIRRYLDYREWHAHRGEPLAPCALEPGTISEGYTLSDFFENVGKFHRKDEFDICFPRYPYSNHLTKDNVESFYTWFLATRCEKAMRANKPLSFSLTELRKKYKLSKEDASFVLYLIRAFNSIAISKIQSEYDKLKNLDCIVVSNIQETRDPVFISSTDSLTKANVKEFLSYMKRMCHHIYALWEHAPLDVFSIELDKEHGIYNDPQSFRSFSFDEFFNEYKTLADDHYFALVFNAVHLRTQGDCNFEYGAILYKFFLRYHCEKAIYNRSEIVLTDALAHEYGLTDADREIVTALLAELNSEIKKDYKGSCPGRRFSNDKS